MDNMGFEVGVKLNEENAADFFHNCEAMIAAAKMTKEQVQEFIERVENLIVLRNMSKAEFYKKAGYTDAAYSQWVTGQTTQNLTLEYTNQSAYQHDTTN